MICNQNWGFNKKLSPIGTKVAFKIIKWPTIGCGDDYTNLNILKSIELYFKPDEVMFQ